MNANPLLNKLIKLRDVVKDEEANRNEALIILDKNVASLKQEYNSLLVDYIKESRVLKGVNWKLLYTDFNELTLTELDWKVDLKTELGELAEQGYDYLQITLLEEHVQRLKGDTYASSLITLYIPDEQSHSPYIHFRSVEHLASFIVDYELDVDLTDLQRVIDIKTEEVTILNSIKQSVPN